MGDSNSVELDRQLEASLSSVSPGEMPPIPDFLIVTPEEAERRKESWFRSPPKPFCFVPEQKKELDPEAVKILDEVREQKRIKAINRIAKMKSKQNAKGMKWDPKTAKFVPGCANKASANVVTGGARVASDDLGEQVSSRFGADRVGLERFAKNNGVWEDKYGALNNGLCRMTIVNRLRNLVKKGRQVNW